MASAACGASTPGAGATSPRIVTLVATNFGYEPSHVEVHRGETIHFVLENPTDLPHEIFVGSEEDQALHAATHHAVGDGAATDRGYPNAVYVPPRGVAQLDVRFDDPAMTVIGCHLAGHWESGMRAEVVFVP